jgi:hypothetical protein
MPTDKENVAFLYAIVRQLETKHVNWRTVAAECNINNDHAARMRFHRLRQKADNLVPNKRGPRKDAPGKGGKKAQFADDDEDDVDYPSLKRKKMAATKMEEESEDDLDVHRRAKRLMKREPAVKTEGVAYAAAEVEVKSEAVPAVASGFGVEVSLPRVFWNHHLFRTVTNPSP